MEKSYFVDTSAYLAHGRNEFWTKDLEKVGQIYTVRSVFDEVSSIVRHNKNGDANVKIAFQSISKIEKVLSKTKILDSPEISCDVYDAHNRALVKDKSSICKNPMSEEDFHLVELARQFSIENSNLETLLMTSDDTMCISANEVLDTELKVVDPFSRSWFKSNVKGVHPHFMIEDAYKDLTKFFDEDTDFHTQRVYGNCYFKDRTAYVYSFTNEPVIKQGINKSDRSFMLGLNVARGIYGDDETKFRFRNMIKNSGYITVLDPTDINDIYLCALDRQISFARIQLINKQMNGKRVQQAQQAANSINKIFMKTDDSLLYTLKKRHILRVGNREFLKSLELRRKESLKQLE